MSTHFVCKTVSSKMTRKLLQAAKYTITDSPYRPESRSDTLLASHHVTFRFPSDSQRNACGVNMFLCQRICGSVVNNSIIYTFIMYRHRIYAIQFAPFSPQIRSPRSGIRCAFFFSSQFAALIYGFGCFCWVWFGFGLICVAVSGFPFSIKWDLLNGFCHICLQCHSSKRHISR